MLVMAEKEKWAGRGTRKCPKCMWSYSTFKKPEHCPKCHFLLGGKYKDVNPSQKRKKLDNPDAVAVCKFSNNSLFSVKVTTRDDRTFCLVLDESRLCYFKACKNFQPLTVASGQKNGQIFLSTFREIEWNGICNGGIQLNCRTCLIMTIDGGC